MGLIRFYQRYLSGLKPCPTCRFTPTCSGYAYEAFEKRGFFAGFALMIWRLLRCSPLSPGGYDPVPETGFRTMPMRWSRYDRYLEENAEKIAAWEQSQAAQDDASGAPSPEDASGEAESAAPADGDGSEP